MTDPTAPEAVSVAVIDSGVNPDHPHIASVAGGARIGLDGSAGDDWVDRLGHGTAVFAAIQEKAPAARIYALRVFDGRLSTSVRALVAAIEWAAEQRIHLVNLSLGTSAAGHREMLETAAEGLGDRGGIVVAAAESDGVLWLPGSLPTALGVIVDTELDRGDVYVTRVPGGHRVVAASPFPRPIPGVPPERNLNGVSFAVANVTGTVAALVETLGDRPGREEILAALPQG